MLRAAKTAEALITTGQTPTMEKDGDVGLNEDEDVDDISTVEGGGVDINTLTPQTFLVRPTRPDANRNRGKKAFKRRPPSNVKPTSTPAAIPVVAPVQVIEEEDDEEVIEEIPFDETLVEEMEVLQLGLEEAWFLASALGVLRVLDSTTVSFANLHP
jgi:tRNA-splicing endonuclease subunit Sen2